MGILVNFIMGIGGGGIMRIVVEVIHLFTAKAENERHRDDLKHESEMFDKQAGHELAMANLNITAQKIDQDTSWIKAVAEAGKPTGIRWVDAMNGAVRPIITYWFFGIFAGIKTIEMGKSIAISGFHNLAKIWTDQDQQLLGTILGYWFVDRTIGHLRGK